MKAVRGTVVVADDEEGIRVVWEQFLTKLGYAVFCAADGQQALDTIFSVAPDAVVLDVLMPQLNGLDVCRELRSRLETQHLPILIVTALNRSDDIINGLRYGADDYLCKPVRLEELGLRLDNLVRRKQTLDHLETHNEELVQTLGDQSTVFAELFVLSQQMNLAHSLEEVLAILSASLQRSLHCKYAAVLLYDRKTGCFHYRGGAGIPQEMTAALQCSPLDPRVAEAFKNHRPVVLTDGETRPWHLSCLTDGTEATLPTPEILVPMAVGKQHVGLLYLAAPRHKEFVSSDSAVLTYIAQTAAVGINIRLSTLQLAETRDATIFALAKLAESRDELTGNHLLRVQHYCRILADYLRQSPRLGPHLTAEFIEEIWRGAPLHDIGKVGIPDQILLKPGKLTPQEFEIMAQHTIIGGQTLEAVEQKLQFESFLRTARAICYWHHEKWDGTGYPHRLRGDDIPLAARLLAVADVYDALTTARPYKPAFSHERAFQIIAEGRGRHFDPEICDAFIHLADRFAATSRELSDRDMPPSLLQTVASRG